MPSHDATLQLAGRHLCIQLMFSACNQCAKAKITGCGAVLVCMTLTIPRPTIYTASCTAATERAGGLQPVGGAPVETVPAARRQGRRCGGR